MWTEVPSCLAWLREAVFLAATLAWAKTGNRMAARIAMIAITTSSSMRVKALFWDLCMTRSDKEGGYLSSVRHRAVDSATEKASRRTPNPLRILEVRRKDFG
ncbi:hypothetical protein BH11ARM2_BH11ARM2_10010 [soil metagenome]